MRVVGVLLRQGSKYVLQHRDNKPEVDQPNTYSVWGGIVEDDESFRQAAVRELKEETGVVASENDLKELFSYEELPEDTNPRKAIPTMIYSLEIPANQKVQCNEGQGLVYLESLQDIAPEKRAKNIQKIIQKFSF